jgi:hypothetical protein
VLDCGVPIEVDSALAVAEDAPTRLHVFDGRLVGEGVIYSDGKRNNDVAIRWAGTTGAVEWAARVERRARFRVSLEYGAAAPPDSAGSVEVTVGSQRLAARGAPTGGGSTFATRDVGEVVLDPGHFTIRVRRADAGAGELMRLRRLVLTPTPARE